MSVRLTQKKINDEELRSKKARKDLQQIVNGHCTHKRFSISDCVAKKGKERGQLFG